MFSQTRSLLRVSFFQNAFHTHKSLGQEKSRLEIFLKPIIESPPKPHYSLAFFDKDIQVLLKKITRIDLEKTFRAKPRGEKLSAPKYKFLTTEELESELKESKKRAEVLLQIPPLVTPTEDKIEILDSDTSLDGFDLHHAKHIFTDVSFSKTNENRTVVVREPNGVLRTASKSERFRVNQIYHPTPGRELETPAMFFNEYLMDVLRRKEYEFILDRACVQFEPQDQDYHQVISVTYSAINYCEDFQMLQSTRHYGSLAFYLVTHKNIDNMLGFHINQDGIETASCLVEIYHKIHPDCQSAKLSEGKTELERVKNFIEHDSNNKRTLENILQNSLDRKKNKEELERGVREAHGLHNS